MVDVLDKQLLATKLEELLADIQAKEDGLHPDPTSPTINWKWLGEHPDEIAELAAVLHEAAPGRIITPYRQSTIRRTFTADLRRAHSAQQDLLLLERLKKAQPLPNIAGRLDWARLVATISSEIVSFAKSRQASTLTSPQPGAPSLVAKSGLESPPPLSEMLEVNSGGSVFFALFQSVYQESPAPTPPVSRSVTPEKGTLDSVSDAALISSSASVGSSSDNTASLAAKTLLSISSTASQVSQDLGALPFTEREGCLVIKFVPSRLLCQSEQFAAELARHVGICAPDSRIIRKRGSTEAEWKAAYDAAVSISDRCPDLVEEMDRSECMLVMEYIPGQGLFKNEDVFDIPHGLKTLEDLGRLFTLDMVLGNSDRLPCDALGWRGNPENALCGLDGRFKGRVVAIDAVVQRRPPGGLMSSEDAACERLVELALNDPGVAGIILTEAVGTCDAAAELAKSPEGVEQFQKGLQMGLKSVLKVKGLLEMMHQCIGEWITDFIADIESSHPIAPPRTGSGRRSSLSSNSRTVSGYDGFLSGQNSLTTIPSLTSQPSPSVTTQKIRAINHEAQRNVDVSEKVANWKASFRDRGAELRCAVEEWQQKKGFLEEGTTLTTGFLDGTHPVVDMYELRVRLDHMLQRLRVLQQATATARPTQLLPSLFLSGAVEANSLHLLKHLGVTHIINATEDLLPPDTGRGFEWLRVPLRDTPEEDITEYFPQAASFIDGALEVGGGVLVHCHAGQSRSCSLVLAWLMTSRKWTLKTAIEWLHERRPQAAPNAGYMAALAALEEELFGRQTVKVKRTKPESKVCPECGEKVGISDKSLKVHLRLKHPTLKIKAIRATTESLDNELKNMKLENEVMDVEKELAALESENKTNYQMTDSQDA